MLPQTHLPLDHPLAAEFLDTHFPNRPVRTVPVTGEMKVSQCYANVRQKVAEQGGTGHSGFVLTLLPGRFIEALHHAVWRDRFGLLQDVTGPAYPPMGKTPISFIEDLIPQVGPPDPAVPSIFLQLDDEAGTREYIELTRRRSERRHQMLAMLSGASVVKGKARLPRLDAERYKRLEREVRLLQSRRALYVGRFNRGEFSYLNR